MTKRYRRLTEPGGLGCNHWTLIDQSSDIAYGANVTKRYRRMTEPGVLGCKHWILVDLFAQ